MMELTRVQIEILLELSNLESFSAAQLAKRLDKHKSNLSGPLRELKGLGIINKGEERESKQGMRYLERPYSISLEHADGSEKILLYFELTVKKLIEIEEESYSFKLFKSKYVNELIRKYGFLAIYNIIKKYMGDDEFNKIVSQSILNQTTIKTELKKYTKNLINDSKLYDQPIIVLNPYEDNIIGLLREFNPIEAVSFYRKVINDKYSRIFRGLHRNFFSQNIKKYVELDIILSPFTSYPINDPIKLLFSNPFERLYDDIYLMDESDYERFIQRAFVFFSNFGDILSQGMRHLRWQEMDRLGNEINELESEKETTELDHWDEEKDLIIEYLCKEMTSLDNIEKSLDTLLKTSIFYWNITSSRIDSLCWKLNYKENREVRSGKYHILTDEKGVKVIDLETNDNIFKPDESKEIIGTYFLMDVLLDDIKDPFTDLRPCNIFEEVGLRIETNTYKELLADFKSRMIG
jgi:DNA-binding transcriptional ArsR family regulator